MSGPMKLMPTMKTMIPRLIIALRSRTEAPLSPPRVTATSASPASSIITCASSAAWVGAVVCVVERDRRRRRLA